MNDAREVFNYVQALQFGLERVKALPVSLRLIREIHARLIENVRGGKLTPGESRRSQNWIGPARSTLENATYVPPPNESNPHRIYKEYADSYKHFRARQGIRKHFRKLGPVRVTRGPIRRRDILGGIINDNSRQPPDSILSYG
jgi:hypothetical protein